MVKKSFCCREFCEANGDPVWGSPAPPTTVSLMCEAKKAGSMLRRLPSVSTISGLILLTMIIRPCAPRPDPEPADVGGISGDLLVHSFSSTLNLEVSVRSDVLKLDDPNSRRMVDAR